MNLPGLFTVFGLQLKRDLRLAFRRWGQILNPLIFFLIVTTLFPLALSPELSFLRDISAGVLWVAALLSSLLALDLLFRADVDDGTMEQLALSPQPLAWLLLAKTTAHWLISGLPLVIISPVVATSLFMPTEAMPTLMLALALGTPILSLIGAIGAALTVGLQRGSVLLSLLVMPLVTPVLIFGARATDLAVSGEDPTGPLYLLAAMLMASLTMTPIASAAAIRISLD